MNYLPHAAINFLPLIQEENEEQLKSLKDKKQKELFYNQAIFTKNDENCLNPIVPFQNYGIKEEEKEEEDFE